MENQYRFGPEERVEVGAVDEVVVSAIDDEEARRSGFTSATELRTFLMKHSPNTIVLMFLASDGISK